MPGSLVTHGVSPASDSALIDRRRDDHARITAHADHTQGRGLWSPDATPAPGVGIGIGIGTHSARTASPRVSRETTCRFAVFKASYFHSPPAAPHRPSTRRSPRPGPSVHA